MNTQISGGPKTSKKKQQVKMSKERKPAIVRNTEGRGVPLHPDVKKVAVKVYEFFLAESKCLEKYNEPLLPFDKIFDRASIALGIGTSITQKIIKVVSKEAKETGVSKLLESFCPEITNRKKKEELDKMQNIYLQYKDPLENIGKHSSGSSSLHIDVQSMTKSLANNRYLSKGQGNTVEKQSTKVCNCMKSIDTKFKDISVEENFLIEKAKLQRQSYLMQMYPQNQDSSIEIPLKSVVNIASEDTLDSEETIISSTNLPENSKSMRKCFEINSNVSKAVHETSYEHYQDNLNAICEVQVLEDKAALKNAMENYSYQSIRKINVNNSPTSSKFISKAPTKFIVPVRMGPKGAISKEVVVRVGSKEIIVPLKNIRPLQDSTKKGQNTPKKIIVKLENTKNLEYLS